MTASTKQQQLRESLVAQPDGPSRLAWLIDQARQRPLLPAEWRADEHQVEGCLVRLWFVPEWRDGRCWFRAESDSLVVKAVAGFLCDYFSGLTPEEILAHPPELLPDLGITQHLTPNRRNGLSRVQKKIRAFAETHLTPADAAPARKS
jgi:cysteine desulfuration protein SufE